MTGSSGSGYGGGFRDTAVACDALVIETQISSPNRLLKYLSTRRLPESQYYPIPCVA